MNKQAVLTHGGMTQDITRSKSPNQFYFEGMNIRVTASNDSSNGAVTNDKGNTLLFKIPELTLDKTLKIIKYNDLTLPYVNTRIETLFEKTGINNQIIVGNTTTKSGFVFISSNNEGFDCIWELNEESLTINLLYVGDLNLRYTHPLQILNNYENDQIDKIYFVDGKEQLRFLNIRHSIENYDNENLIDLDESILNIVADVTLVDPVINEISYGGTHTAGTIQYAYSYYKINGAQSRLSPMSKMISLGKSDIKGGDLNEIVGTIPKIEINEIDPKFTNLRLYSIKYTSYNQLPTVSLIADRDISGLSNFIYFDDGRILNSVTLDELLFLSNGYMIPKHIESKDSRLFLFNYRDRIYNLNYKNNKLDVRAFSFPKSSNLTQVYDRITEYPVTSSEYKNITTPYVENKLHLDETHSAINGDYSKNKYQHNSSIIGGEGPLLKYEIIRSSQNKINFQDLKFLKEGELYRIAIQFYNKYGIKSLPLWIADFIVSADNVQHTNLNGFYAGLKLTLKPEFFVWLNTSSNFLNENGIFDPFLKPVGFKLLRAERTISDRTIVAQGLINGMLSHSKLTGNPPAETEMQWANEGVKMPSWMRRFDDYLCPVFGVQNYKRLDGPSGHPEWSGRNIRRGRADGEIFASAENRSATFQFNQLMQMYSPELTFETLNSINARNLKVVGGALNSFNGVKSRWEKWETGEFGPFEIVNNAISAYDYKSDNMNAETGARGIIGPTYIHKDENRKKSMASHYFRDYSGGFVLNTDSTNYEVYGTPEVTDFRSESKRYNNDVNLIYVNTLENLTSDSAGHNNSDDENTMIRSTLTAGSRCATFALGEESLDVKNRPNIKNLYEKTSFYQKLPSTSTGGVQNYSLNFVVSTYDDLLNFGDFSQYNIGVLETGNVYNKNNPYQVVTTLNFQNVVKFFPSTQAFDDLEPSDRTALIGKKIVIGHANWGIWLAPSQNNIRIYNVVSGQTTSMGGLSASSELFEHVHPLLFSCKFLVHTVAEMNAIDKSKLPVGGSGQVARIGVLDTGEVYEWRYEAINPFSYSFVKLTTIPTLTLANSTDASNGGVGLICEFSQNQSSIYIGNYYGGNSYEAKRKTVYVEASNYFKIENLNSFEVSILDPGDTFVQTYNIARLSKTPYEDKFGSDFAYITEVISVKLESTINQFKRNDESNEKWDNPFFPSQGDFHSYNRVYSQDANLLKSSTLSYEVKVNENYSTAIIASHIKRPGETIDNWSKLSINDIMFVDGKYGAINSVCKTRDEIITLQDSAIAKIEINPRVQLNTTDGTGVHLGTGAVLYDYKYLTTSSGTLNKFGSISTNSGLFYYDTLNNMIGLIAEGVVKLSDAKGLHSFMFNNIDAKTIRKNNHILQEGIMMGYDYFNNDVYFTFLQKDKSKTLCFNEILSEFVSLHSFKPSFYFNKGEIFITSNPSLNKGYIHKEGVYNIYYDEYEPSYIIYSLNPENGRTCIFNNLNYKSEVYNSDEDVDNRTLTQIKSFNEYQNSGMKPLIIGRNGNIRRRFRDWNCEIPREGRDRMRSPWIYLHLQFDNFNNDRIILHDVGYSYTI